MQGGTEKAIALMNMIATQPLDASILSRQEETNISEEDKTLFYGLTRIIYSILQSLSSSFASEYPSLQFILKYFTIEKVFPWYIAMSRYLFPEDMVMQVTMLELLGMLAQFYATAQEVAQENSANVGGKKGKKNKKAQEEVDLAGDAEQQYQQAHEAIVNALTPSFFFSMSTFLLTYSSTSSHSTPSLIGSTEGTTKSKKTNAMDHDEERWNVFHWYLQSCMKLSFAFQHQVF
jgi:hypothetical protein